MVPEEDDEIVHEIGLHLASPDYKLLRFAAF